jgi:hypothetical protein
MVPFLQVLQPKFYLHFPYLPCVLHALSTHPPWFDLSNNVCWSIQVMNLLMVTCSLLCVESTTMKAWVRAMDVTFHTFGDRLRWVTSIMLLTALASWLFTMKYSVHGCCLHLVLTSCSPKVQCIWCTVSFYFKYKYVIKLSDITCQNLCKFTR